MRYASMSSMTGFNPAPGQVRFEGKVKSGRGTEDIGVVVPMDTIIALAEAFKHTDAPGHAIWHIQNGREFPCETCGKTEGGGANG